METFKKILVVFDVFGLRKIYSWLSNKKKKFEPKEIFINWVIFLIALLLIIFLSVFSILSADIDINFKNLTTVPLPRTANIFGGGSFVLALMLLVTLPFKVWFKAKRVQKQEKGKDDK